MLNITVAPITKWFGEGATEAEHPCGKVTEARKEELGDSHAPEYGRCLPGYSRSKKNWNGMWKDYDEPICSTDGQETNSAGTLTLTLTLINWMARSQTARGPSATLALQSGVKAAVPCGRTAEGSPSTGTRKRSTPMLPGWSFRDAPGRR